MKKSPLVKPLFVKMRNMSELPQLLNDSIGEILAHHSSLRYAYNPLSSLLLMRSKIDFLAF
jgi:hypothetical protein